MVYDDTQRANTLRCRIFSSIVAASAALLLLAGVASADPCLNDAFGAPTSCTASDFGVASIVMTDIHDDGCQFLGDTVTFDAMLTVAGTKTARYDIGFYIANDSVQALTGECTDAVIPPGMSSNDDGDACGDFDGESVSVPVSDVTVTCADSDNDGFFDLVVCASYRQNAHDVCNGPADATPGTNSKCNCQRVVTDQAVPPCQSNADCADDGNPCTDEVCNAPQSGVGDASGCSHEANTATCDDGLFCNGADTCSGGSCHHEGSPCTLCVDSCNEDTNQCEPVADPASCADHSICRGPRYWGTHGGFEGTAPVNLTQDVLDAAGPLNVCGHSIDRTSNADSPFLDHLGLDSALESLCVRPKNVKLRRLDRELVATALNCSISGRADCDAFVESKVGIAYSDCNDVCAGTSVDPGAPSIGKCVSTLSCFNDGGEIVGGQCAFGTCESDASLYCGAEYGPCPDIDGQPQRCTRFADNCRTEPLCNEGLGVCPAKTPRSSGQACREAMADDCAIESCMP